MKSMTIMAMTFMSVAAVPMAKEAHLENLVSTLFNGPKASEHNRVRRAEDELDMCSYRMQNITRLADVAGAVFVSIFSRKTHFFKKISYLWYILDVGRRLTTLQKI